MNAEVQKLKKSRDEFRAETTGKRQRLKEQIANIGNIKSKEKGNYQKTKDEIDKLEWEIQTSPHTPIKEREIITRIAELEEKLKIQKKELELIQEIRKLTKEIKDMDNKAAFKHEKLVEFVGESEKHHQAMMKLVDEATDIKQMADEEHQKFINVKEKLYGVQKKYVKTISKIKSLRNQIKDFYKRGSIEKQEELRKKIESEASKKLEKGKKLSFEEFKILIEKGQV